MKLCFLKLCGLRNIGFEIMDGVFFDIQATNLLDRKYRQYPGLPIIGRRVLFKTTINF